MSAPLSTIRKSALNPPQLARKAISNPRLIPEILEGLNAENSGIKYGCAKALCLTGERHPERLYPYWDCFVRLLSHENKIFQWNAAYVLSQVARVDAQNKFARIFRKYFSPIPGPVMITAANVIQGGARIAQAKPHLADRIAAEVLRVAKARYQTAECRNVAIGHAIVALGKILPLLDRPAPIIQFVRKQTRNPRPATQKKAAQFLKTHL